MPITVPVEDSSGGDQDEIGGKEEIEVDELDPSDEEEIGDAPQRKARRIPMRLLLLRQPHTSLLSSLLLLQYTHMENQPKSLPSSIENVILFSFSLTTSTKTF